MYPIVAFALFTLVSSSLAFAETFLLTTPISADVDNFLPDYYIALAETPDRLGFRLIEPTGGVLRCEITKCLPMALFFSFPVTSQPGALIKLGKTVARSGGGQLLAVLVREHDSLIEPLRGFLTGAKRSATTDGVEFSKAGQVLKFMSLDDEFAREAASFESFHNAMHAGGKKDSVRSLHPAAAHCLPRKRGSNGRTNPRAQCTRSDR